MTKRGQLRYEYFIETGIVWIDTNDNIEMDYLKWVENKALTLTDVVKSLPTKEEINLAANECSDINEIICEDEYWVIAKNDGFKEGADFVINKLK